jgi:hypothetical protein
MALRNDLRRCKALSPRPAQSPFLRLAGLLDDVIKASRLQQNEHLTLVVDSWTIKVLGSALRFVELMDHGVISTYAPTHSFNGWSW